MKQADKDAFDKLPAAESCRRIEFDESMIHTGFVNDTYFLNVAGMKPWANMDVYLQPLIYAEKPDYWGIEVIGCLRGIGLPAEAPYTAILEISSFRGHKGIEVIGANKKVRHDI